MLRWQIYYDDDSMFSNLDGSFSIAPGRGVQVIVQEDVDHNWATQSGENYYVWDERGNGARWWGVDIFGLFDYLLEPGLKKVLFGRTVTSERFTQIFNRVQNDPEWGKKAAFRRRERKP